MILTAKEWLMRAWRIDEEIETLRRARDETFICCTSVTPSYEGDSVSGTKDPHKFDQLAEYAAQINAKVDELIAIKREIEAAIEQVNDGTYRELLRRRYLCCERWEQIAVGMGYDYRWVLRLHGRALLEIKDAIESHIKPVL